MSRQQNLRRLLAPQKVAFIGGRDLASSIQDCVNSGFDGDLWVVNPKYDEIAGYQCYKSIDDLPSAPDAAFVAVNRDLTVKAVADLASKGTAGCVCYAAGFSEVGGDGIAKQEALIEAAGDMALVGPNCYGLLNYVDGVTLWPDTHGGKPVDRGVAIISQSGNIALNLTMSERSMPIAHVISAGNQAILGIGDYIDALVDDDRVTAIGLYVEGLNDIEGFSRSAARALEKGIPIVALKSGTSDLGAELTMSHTSSLAGSRELYQALFDRLGIIQVASLSAMLESLKLLSALQSPLQGKRLNVLTCSGGDSAIMADTASQYGFDIPRFSDDQISSLKEQLPDFASVSNPLDYNTSLWGNKDALRGCFKTVMQGKADLTLLVLDFPREGLAGHQPWNAAVEAIIEASQQCNSPAAVVATIPELLPRAARERLIEMGVAPLQGVDMAFRALDGVASYAKRRAEILQDGSAAHTLLSNAHQPDGTVTLIDEWRSKQALSAYGLSVPPSRLVAEEEAGKAASDIGFPVVAKAVSSKLAHKTELGAVKLGLKSAEMAQEAVAEIKSNVQEIDGAGEEFLIEAMVPGAVSELIIGLKRDPQFGLALVIGTGGILVNLIEDSQALLLPTTRAEVSRALSKLKMAKLLNGYRGQEPADIDAIIDAAMAIANYAMDNQDTIMELDVNPLFALPQGKGVVAADAMIRVATSEAAE